MREGGHSPACSPGRALSAEGKASSGRERAPRKALNSADVIIEAGSASEQHCLGSWRARTAEAPVPGGVLEGACSRSSPHCLFGCWKLQNLLTHELRLTKVW